MRRFWFLTGAFTAASSLALVATLRWPSLGVPLWHYNAAFVLLTGAAAGAWPRLRQRRVATLTMAFTGILATATGFVMLYSKEFPYKEWITWWHSATSFALLVTFLAHWLNNHPRLLDFTKRLFTRERPAGVVAAGAWTGLIAFGAWTSLPDVRARFTTENYLYLSSWAILVGVALPYGMWLAYRVPAMTKRLRETAHRNLARALVDTSLFLAHWAALLTGFALLYFADFLRDGTFKYVSKWWHTAASALFLALVALHVGFNARVLKAHAERVDEERG